MLIARHSREGGSARQDGSLSDVENVFSEMSTFKAVHLWHGAPNVAWMEFLAALLSIHIK